VLLNVLSNKIKRFSKSSTGAACWHSAFIFWFLSHPKKATTLLNNIGCSVKIVKLIRRMSTDVVSSSVDFSITATAPPPLTHGEVPAGKNCGYCYDDISSENYTEYLPYPPAAQPGSADETEWKWLPCVYCVDCLEYMLTKQWSIYVERVKTTDCKAEQRRLLTTGPPINFKDNKAMPCPNEGEVYMFWYSRDNTTKVAKLPDSLVGEVSSLIVFRSC
jgi:hypothetical protein